MSGAKEIRSKISSVQSTQKITSAMQMVAASKMRKTQKRMQEARPYAHAMRRVIHHIADGHIEYHHPFLTERKIEHVGYIIVSTDRGLCGGLNINEFRQTVIDMKKWHDQNVECEASIIGSKGISSSTIVPNS